MRYVKAAALGVLAALCAFVAYGPLSNLWADYRDSPTSTYLLLGLPPLAVSVASLIAAIRVLRKP